MALELDFGSMLAQMANDRKSKENDYTLPVREAQRDVLLSILAAAQLAESRPPFKRGDFVRYAESAGPLNKKAVADLQLMFWRYLDPDRDEDRRRLKRAGEELALLSTVDCMLVTFGGSRVQFDISSSELLVLDTNQGG